jgi:hypothetical protein
VLQVNLDRASRHPARLEPDSGPGREGAGRILEQAVEKPFSGGLPRGKIGFFHRAGI